MYDLKQAWNEKNMQKVFDITVAYAKTMTEPAVEHNKCLYRTSDGRACFIGNLIKDEDYIPEMENKAVGKVLFLLGIHTIPKAELSDARNFKTFLNKLQNIHDGSGKDSWFAIGFPRLAQQFNLTYTPDGA